MFGVAGYAAKQSTGHRNREIGARRLEMDLAAFGPMVKDLPEEKRDDVRSEFITRVFARKTAVESQGEATVSDSNLTVLGHFVEILKEAGTIGRGS